MDQKQIRNIAIIAHVDHGKTTLVDFLLKQSGTFHAKADELGQDLIMDSNDLERERGITILAKNTAIIYKGVKINIVDTPGHADFGGEVERTLNMADGAVLLVDAQEGPMPQTKFVLKKALEMGLRVIVVINKIDKNGADINGTVNETTDLFLHLAHEDTHLEFPIVYAIGREGKAWDHIPSEAEKNGPATLETLFQKIIEFIPAPTGDNNGPFQMLIAALDKDAYFGRYSIGRVVRGIAKPGTNVAIVNPGEKPILSRIEKVFVYNGLKRVEVPSAEAGDIVALTGIKEANMSATVADPDHPEPLPLIRVEEPTLRVTIGPNTSPFMGKEGKFVTSRQIGERLEKELETNVGFRLESIGGSEFILSGRGELHLSVFFETLRREGFEFQVSRPEVIFKKVDGIEMEPMEEITIDVPDEYVGAVISEIGKRRAELINLFNHTNGITRAVYKLSTRGFLGLRSVLMTQTRGTVIINSISLGYEPIGQSLGRERNGVLIASETGQAVAFGLETAQGRGTSFVGPGTQVYEGMIIGLNSRKEDICINVCKGKELSNMRSKGSDEKIILAPPVTLSLEQALDFIEDEELLELTPQNIRLRKRYLTENERIKVRRSKPQN